MLQFLHQIGMHDIRDRLHRGRSTVELLSCHQFDKSLVIGTLYAGGNQGGGDALAHHIAGQQVHRMIVKALEVVKIASNAFRTFAVTGQ